LLESVKQTHVDLDIKGQTNLFKKWTNEQEADLNQQIRNFAINEKKKEILSILDELEKREELLTFFDKRQEIIDHYYGRGFATECPSNIPVEPDETKFKIKAERHFKPWPKYMNRPESSYKTSNRMEYKLESLRKIYLNNSKAITTPEKKLVTNTKSKQDQKQKKAT
jgi:hypothetical protein